MHSAVVHTSRSRLPGLSGNVYIMKQISYIFWKQTPVLQFPHLALSLEGNPLLDFGEQCVNSSLGNKAAEMRNSSPVSESPALVHHGGSYFPTRVCQRTFHPAHTFFQHLCLALTSCWGWCRLVPGWARSSQGLSVCVEMNGTPGLCSFCRRKFYNHILHILSFPFI